MGVVLSDHLPGIGTLRNSAETQQSGHTSKSGLKVKNRDCIERKID